MAHSWAIVSAEAPSNIGWQALGPAIGFTTVAVIVVLMRWYTRAILTKRVGTEDYLITMATVYSLQ